jgi:hypothetical protein
VDPPSIDDYPRRLPGLANALKMTARDRDRD